MALFGVEFGAEASEGAGGFGGFVGGAGEALTGAFFVVEAVRGQVLVEKCGRRKGIAAGLPFAMLLLPSFDVFVLRLASG